MKGVGFRGYRLNNRNHLGGSTPPPVVPVSSLLFQSTGDVDSPEVGDVLFFDLNYISLGANLLDTTATVVDFKRGGVSIPLISGATQYVVTQQDIGLILSLEITPIEQGGATQPTLIGTSLDPTTGTAVWTLGELQTSYQALYFPNDNIYPKIQRHRAELDTSVYKIKSLSGNGVDMVAPQASNISDYDTITNSIMGTGAMKLRFIKDIPSYNADNMTYFARFKVPSIDAFFFKDMGLGNIAFFDTPNNRIDYDGLRSANNSLNPDDEAIVILRTSSTAFTTINSVAGQKREIYIKVISGVTPGEYHQQAPTEFITSFTYGFQGGVTEMSGFSAPLRAWGMSTDFMGDTEMTNLINYLTTI